MSKRSEISEEELEAWIAGVHQSCPCEGRRGQADDPLTRSWIKQQDVTRQNCSEAPESN
ncbi:MAG: hypothetical protein RL095_3542 [Verrucomicrobiota bacterium]